MLRYSPTELYDGAQIAIFGDFLHSVFSASHVEHGSDLHPKFALRPHMCGSMVDIQSSTADIRRGQKKRKKKKEEEERNRMKI